KDAAEVFSECPCQSPNSCIYKHSPPYILHPSQVPRTTFSPLAFITFSAKGTTVRLAERRSVAIQNVDSVVFVQTDKPIYKPGETVCALQCQVIFTAPTSNFTCPTPTDPQGNRIFQWLNVTSQVAIVQLTFQLIKEPMLGNYQITVEKKSGSSTRHSFFVEEYVLPKFEVTVNAPKSVSVLNPDLTANAYLVNLLINVSSSSWACLAGVQLTGSAYISITQVLGSVRFENMDQSYKRGIPYFGQIKLVNENNSPMANEVVQLLLNDKNVGNYTTNGNGTVQFSIDTSEMFNPQFTLRRYCAGEREVGWLIPYYPEAYYSVQRFYSLTNSFVKIKLEPEEFSCGQQRSITVHYVLNKYSYGKITSVKFYHVVSTFSIPLAVSEKLAPAARMLVYTVHPARELVADSARFQIEKCFKNKVRLQFSKKQGLPASNVSLHLEASANSHCALRAVDESVLLLRPERELSAETVSPQVYNLLPLQELYGYYFNGLNLEDDSKEPCIPADSIFHNGLYYIPVSSDFDDSRGRVMTETVRKFFPETWIWDLFSVGSTGKANVVFTIPDTITEWKASVFCLEKESGFGISAPTSLTAFQPFFVDMTLPYSIIHGEDFLLRANVFNYLDKCIKVCDVMFSVTAETKKNSGKCGNTTSGRPEIGWKDTLIRTLLVEVQWKALTLCDIMGTAMQNLQQLLRMPFGCGEQNMVLFVPNIYVLDYLNKTGQLTEEIKSKAIGYLVSGYQKQLSYKHPDGSYSIFGTRDKEGNTWLTAFVYKSFAQAKRYIFIDDSVQSQTLIWLSSKQKSNGCFQSVGKLFNNHPVVRNGLFCLEAASGEEISKVYIQALLAYIFCLVGNEGKCDFFLKELNKSAKKVGGSVHWEREVKPPAETFPSFYSRAPSAEVEMTSYVLKSVLHKPKRAQKDLTFASQIVQWIIRQKNPYGGFSSTQDTVIALQALADYGAATYSENSQNTVKISSSKPFEKVFEVNSHNRLLLQQSSLPDVPGNYILEVNGNGCVFVPSHFSYTGKRNISNMAIIDVKMLSGFVPVSSSLQKVRNGSHMNKPPQGKGGFSFSVEQDLPVSNIKPGSVLIYDYYETGRRFLFRPYTKWGEVSLHLLKLMEGHYSWEADEGLGNQ
uniref:OVOS protein n=1 Tax=Chelonoidis abingdonii TaxID=106734 RepID=A0A8C0G5P8_CHEAB